MKFLEINTIQPHSKIEKIEYEETSLLSFIPFSKKKIKKFYEARVFTSYYKSKEMFCVKNDAFISIDRIHASQAWTNIKDIPDEILLRINIYVDGLERESFAHLDEYENIKVQLRPWI